MSAADELPIRFGPDGLVPVAVQDAETDAVLMLAYMNREALDATRATGEAHYWSRSRNALWHKGATSGHVQHVEELRVNCDLNSLLLRVRQRGAVCHTGYPTCYYRLLGADDSLTVVAERAFDPAEVYGEAGAASAAGDVASAARLLFGAYAYLRDNDLSRESSTSRRLRSPEPATMVRVADELRELAGVLDGSHRHAGLRDDAILEGSQVLYWLLVACFGHGLGWDDLRLDTALAAPSARDADGAVSSLHGLASEWLRAEADAIPDGLPRRTAHAVAAAATVAGVTPLDILAHDLADLRQRAYLAAYFDHADAADAARA